LSRISHTFAVLTAGTVIAAGVAAAAVLSSYGWSASFQVEFTVDSTADTGDASPDGVCDDGTGACTLRAAIEEANSAEGAILVRFNIAGAGPHTIAPQAAELPPILDNVTVDGYTQPGAVKNSEQPGEGTNAALMIEISGESLGGSANGITMMGSNSTVKGLVINGFGGSGVLLAGAVANTVAGNFIGTDVTGTTAVPNGVGVTLEDTHDSAIGTTAAEDTNVISGNGVGIVLAGESAMNVVRRSLIGVKADGVSPLGNGSHGVVMTGGADCNTIGGSPPAYRNVIAFNGGDGVALATDGGINNYVDPNWIHDNGGLGVDINDDGPTPNDGLDADTGPNDMQNYPVLTSAVAEGGGLTVSGYLSSTPRLYFNLFFLANKECDPSGYGEGEQFIDERPVADTDGDGMNVFSFYLSQAVAPGTFIVASASNPESTSEFSQCVAVTEGAPATPTPPAPAGLIQGDVRCDGAVDATDALGILREVAGLPQILQKEPCPELGDVVGGHAFGDILCDGGIDAVDALAALRYVAGLPPIAGGPGCPEVGSPIS